MKRKFSNTSGEKKSSKEALTSRQSPDANTSPSRGNDAMDVDTPANSGAFDAGIGVISVCKTRSDDINDHNETEVDPPSEDAKEKGKTTDGYKVMSLPPRSNLRRPGWGRNNREDFFHNIPELRRDPHNVRRRGVFRLWPRDPQGKVLVREGSPGGTLSPDGFPWGETLYDFFHVDRAPRIPTGGLMAVVTGSRLLELMTEPGEVEAAWPEIQWARTEGKPIDLGVANTEELVRCIEWQLGLDKYLNFSMHEDLRRIAPPLGDDGEDDEDDEEKKGFSEEQKMDDKSKAEGPSTCGIEYDDDKEVDPSTLPPPTTIPLTSPFHPSHYPKPWPFIPLENPLSIVLQERVPLYQLPQTLYVHDPFRILSAHEKRFRNESWLSRPDIIYTYDLELSESVSDEIANARRKAEELEDLKARTSIVLRYKRTKEQVEKHEPIIEVALPPYQRYPTTVEESHLYISPVAKVGKGNHSVVYKGEWELPRNLFVKPRLCQWCFEGSKEREIQRMKDTGQWNEMLSVGSQGPAYTERPLTQVGLNGEVIEREVICTVPPDAPLSQIRQLVDERTNIWEVLMKKKDINYATVDFTEGTDEDEDNLPVVVIRVNPPLSHDSLHMCRCTHGPSRRNLAVPRTAKFTVAVKLSVKYDRHLEREAKNYQSFPEHFFRHYNGYTVIQQLHSIVPVSAIVPQFYGYYTPKKGQGQDQGGEGYLSPILLLEHCGKPIDPKALSREDQEECASLLLRFQRAGWLHDSFAERNFLVQYGKPTEFPIMRETDPEPSFRLIDFGRSRRLGKADDRIPEELEAIKMFEGLCGGMGVSDT